MSNFQQTMPPHEPYQGWYNSYTWQVALTLDNTKALLDEALNCCRSPKESVQSKAANLMLLASRHWNEVLKTGFESLFGIERVNWNELVEHYERKIAEGQ